MKERIHTVGAVAIKDDKVLMVRHGDGAAHLTGVWGLPGGRLDEGETMIDAVCREFEEETGLVPEKESVMQLPTVFKGDIKRKSGEVLKTYWNVFLIKEFTGELSATDETIPEWVEVEKIQELSSLLPNTENAVREGLQLLRHENIR